MDPGSGPNLTMALCLHGEVSSVKVHTAKYITEAEIKAAQALFNVQRMEKQEPSSQTNFFTQSYFDVCYLKYSDGKAIKLLLLFFFVFLLFLGPLRGIWRFPG